MRWIALLYGRITCSLALTNGVHTVEDAVKAVMAGADVANTTSALLHHGIGHITTLVDGFSHWMDEHEYESVDQMKHRLLDAPLISASLGVAAIRDLANAVAIAIVPIPAGVVAKIGEAAYQVGSIPADTYKGQSAEVATVAVQNFLVTHEGVPADTVYAMTKSMLDNLDQMAAAHAAARAIRKDSAAKGMPVPLHPGAEKYYREAGLIK